MSRTSILLAVLFLVPAVSSAIVQETVATAPVENHALGMACLSGWMADPCVDWSRDVTRTGMGQATRQVGVLNDPANGNVIVASHGSAPGMSTGFASRIVYLDEEDGRVITDTLLSPTHLSERAFPNAEFAVDPADSVLYILGLHDPPTGPNFWRVVAVDLFAGAVSWTHDFAANVGNPLAIDVDPTGQRVEVVVHHYQHPNGQGTLFALDTTDGSELRALAVSVAAKSQLWTLEDRTLLTRQVSGSSGSTSYQEMQATFIDLAGNTISAMDPFWLPGTYAWGPSYEPATGMVAWTVRPYAVAGTTPVAHVAWWDGSDGSVASTMPGPGDGGFGDIQGVAWTDAGLLVDGFQDWSNSPILGLYDVSNHAMIWNRTPNSGDAFAALTTPKEILAAPTVGGITLLGVTAKTASASQAVVSGGTIAMRGASYYHHGIFTLELATGNWTGGWLAPDHVVDEVQDLVAGPDGFFVGYSSETVGQTTIRKHATDSGVTDSTFDCKAKTHGKIKAKCSLETPVSSTRASLK